MNAFAYRAGELHAEDVPLTAIAAAVGTPTYVYAAGVMRARLRALQDAFADDPVLVCYAIKANDNLAVIRTLAREGAGADVVSGGELERALAAGVAPERIVFSGIGKTRDELAFALATGVLQINVESVPELLLLDEVARETERRAPIALRVNPDVAAGTHDKISTGRRADKFGIPHDEAHGVYAMAMGLAGIEVTGLHLHIGSQITRLEPFRDAYARGVELARGLIARGVTLRRLDLGGGFGVPYRNEPAFDARAYAAMVREVTAGLDLAIVLEPGRALVAEAGVLLARVIYVKESAGRRFVVLDAGMNVLLRVAMYDAHHEVLPVRAPASGTVPILADVVGPICESSDVFARDRLLPPLAAGDLVVLATAGAYGAVMASDYNARPSAAEVLVDGGRHAVVKPRHMPRERFADEHVPDWLAMPVGVPTATVGG